MTVQHIDKTLTNFGKKCSKDIKSREMGEKQLILLRITLKRANLNQRVKLYN